MKELTHDSNLSLYFQRYYPYRADKISPKRHCAVIGIGGNLGNVKKRFKHLFFTFTKSNIVDIVETSPILKNPPFGYPDQPFFHNAIIVLKTDLSPPKLLKYLLYIEKVYKRERSFANSPRTLDLDIIFFDKISLCKKNLTIPHPHYTNRESVMLPLSYLVNKECFNEITYIYRANSRCRPR